LALIAPSITKTVKITSNFFIINSPLLGFCNFYILINRL